MAKTTLSQTRLMFLAGAAGDPDDQFTKVPIPATTSLRATYVTIFNTCGAQQWCRVFIPGRCVSWQRWFFTGIGIAAAIFNV
jgi:hypothetical protein